jgi:23S rRNA (uracil1939-C5)-methyltransferase
MVFVRLKMKRDDVIMSKVVRIERMNHSGEGIGKLEGVTIFVPKTIIGDVVEVEKIVDYKNYKRATVGKYIERGNDYICSKCKYYNQCGGCHISNLSYDKQLLYKKDKIRDIFKRYLGREIEMEIIPSEDIYRYRNKITLQVDKGRIGLYRNRTNEVVEIDCCLLVSERLNRIIRELKKMDLSRVKSIMLRESWEEVMLVIEGEIDKERLVELEEIDTIICNKEIIKGNGYVVEEIRDLKFIVSPESFFQVNNKQVVRLYDKVLEYAKLNKEDTLIDLYCGTGTIGMYLARYCKNVIGIEIVPSAIRDANRNKDVNGIDNIKFIEGDVGKLISNKYKASVIVVDPPRSGLDKRTRKVLLEMLPRRIVYVSCDTMTMVRDLKELLEEYEIEDGSLVDMFPQTYHVECVCVLNKR